MNASVKAQVASRFSRASQVYVQHANVQQQAAEILLRKITQPSTTLLDLGAGPMQHYDALSTRCTQLVALDLSAGMLEQGPQDAFKVCADMDNLPLADNCVDAIFSNFAMQWSQDHPALFKALNRILKPGGKAYLSVVADGSLCEIQQAWQNVDAHCHVNRFTPFDSLLTYGEEAGFALDDAQLMCLKETFATAQAAFKSVKAIGANQLQHEGQRRGLLGKTQYRKLLAGYPLTNGRAQLSYQVAFMELTKL
ncbi:methyltransferase domain-containing protein [Pseudoalteromonas viridis]|uniref:Methyltransferase domain-containing protein n=1 Tax=Pseudoalteromonas viridis TaxID=339617 RepID=A0ABX7V4Y3_9GAMM|nr:methyltransferase domain-containing protein [Pseudoalteromonas viridis]QTL34861.1 methyltransferase domain-containing protein [Pseudoalteromonas viridis]